MIRDQLHEFVWKVMLADRVMFVFLRRLHVPESEAVGRRVQRASSKPAGLVE